MLKPLTRSFTAIALLFLFAASSALGAHHPRSARTRANRHHSASHHLARHRSAGHHAARHRHPRRRSAHRNALVRKASTTAATALLGDEAVESSKDNLISGQAEAFPFQAGISGTAGAVHVYIDSHNGARTLIVGLYTDLNSHPGALLTTGSLSVPQASAWNTAAVAPTALVSGTTYWLAVLGTGGTLRYRDRWRGPCKAETSHQTNLGVLAAQWSTGTLYSTCPISAYVTPATSTLPEGPLVEVAPVESPPPPPPPPAVPTNSSPPVINGTATEGQSLTATTGAWTESPASYAYQWQDCNSSGAGCVNVTGATSSSHTLTASDVGHTMRVVVTATNTGGSTPASSAATAAVVADPPPPPPPTASFTYSPTSPVTGQPVTLDGSGSTCPDGPCTYTWSDDGGTTRPIPPLWPLGSGQTLQFTFSSAGTKYVRLVVTDAAGQTATVEHNVVVASEPPPPPTPPTNVTAPSVSGTAQVGQILNASNGTWSGSAPMSYAYQWRDCDSAGANCLIIPGAITSTYTLTVGDLGHTVRAVVTATNAGGAASATSAPTATVVAVPPPSAPVNTVLPVISGSAIEGQTLSASQGTWSGSPTSYAYQWEDCDSLGASCVNVGGAVASSYTLGSGDVGHSLRVTVTATNSGGVGTAASEHTAVIEEKGGTPTACFGKEEACGYPGPEDTGVEKGVTLVKHVGSVVVSQAGATIRDERIEGNLEIAANNVTVENVEVVSYSQKKACERTGGVEGGGAVEVEEHQGALSTGIVIRHVTVHGVTKGCPESLGEGISMRESSSAADVKVEWSKVYWTRTCFFQSATWENNYCDDNGELPGAHYDGIFDNGEGTTRANPGLVVKHNTILMPHWQTSPLFLPNEKEVGEERIENNFLAGGGYLMYLAGAHGTTPRVTGPVEVIGNRFARCLGNTTGSKTGGHHLCQGLAEENETTSAPLAPDSFGYFPQGGSYGVLYSTYDAAADHFAGNYWDNNLEAAL
jgi:PKD domain